MIFTFDQKTCNQPCLIFMLLELRAATAQTYILHDDI